MDGDLLDSDMIRALSEVAASAGGETFAIELLGAFESNVKQMVLDFQRAVTTGDQVTMVQVAHRLKGSAGNLGAKALSSHAREIEGALRDGRTVEHLASTLGCVSSKSLRAVRAALLPVVSGVVP